ncbi:unnamed protein product [Clonostachys rosea f. rosea IK726]|uniref:Uncharacterized protein n=1 Tax=Clonostachys rosea f. rosea IK726 TaxID=1349383 RepID=A0ACA9U9P7_BIOOC|nr:unnamed protein product [Clonostachys rosea f. rosea IK726]
MSKMIDEIMTTAWDSLEDDIQSSMQETLDEATPQAYLTFRGPMRHSQVDLFPERSSFEADGGLDGEIWRQVFNNNKPDEQHDDSPWLTIAANFSKCQLTFDSDRLAAIAGLVNKKKMHPQSPQLNGRNFCGLWEQTLHMTCVDLSEG